MESIQSTQWSASEYQKFSSLIRAYLNQQTKDLYYRFPSEESLYEQAKEKLQNYRHREILHTALSRQLSFLELSETQSQNLEKLKLENTVTITTGHQLNLFTGPVYFFYKILQVIKCCRVMNEKYPDLNFVPVFWMATEDHDFEEINHFYYQNQKFSWDRKAGGAVGRLDLTGIKEVFEQFFNILPDSSNASELKDLVKNSYFKSKNLTEASQRLVQELFGKFGLLMIDGDDKELKKLMIPAFEEDLFQHTAFKKVEETNNKLREKDELVQVNPREINLFYLGEGNIRERIVLLNDEFFVLNTDYKFSKDEIREELNVHPEKFSPNVILRPLYQESILPNIAYIGGSGESAYWLQLKGMFETMKVAYPLVIVRNSVLILSENQNRKLEKLSVSFLDLMQPLNQIINKNIEKHSTLEIDFGKYENTLNQMFDELEEKAKQTDVSFSKMINAQRSKQTKGLDKMKKRLLHAEKIRQADRVQRINALYSGIFPQNELQERIMNFSEIQLAYGLDFMDEILSEIKPVDFCFTIKTFNN